MRKLIALGIFGLLFASQAHAQAPAPSTPAAAPPAAAATAQPACEGTDKKSMRKCQQQKLRDARKALDQKISEACQKQGVKRPDMAACRVEMLAKAAAAVQ